MLLHRDGRKPVFPHVTQHGERGVSSWELYAASVNPDLKLIRYWLGKNKPSHTEIVRAIAQIKAYAADATCEEEQRQV